MISLQTGCAPATDVFGWSASSGRKRIASDRDPVLTGRQNVAQASTSSKISSATVTQRPNGDIGHCYADTSIIARDDDGGISTCKLASGERPAQVRDKVACGGRSIPIKNPCWTSAASSCDRRTNCPTRTRSDASFQTASCCGRSADGSIGAGIGSVGNWPHNGPSQGFAGTGCPATPWLPSVNS